MKPVAMDGSDDTVSQSSDEPLVGLQIYVPDLLLQKCMHFHRDELIWDVKHQIIGSLPKELKESFNYGLFCPPVNGKAGKFLDEERPLVEYPFPEPGAFLELRYKRRIYKMMNVEEKQVKQMHTRANLRRMLENVGNCNVEKVSKLCARGMDPNFHCPETGETPLSVATGLSQPAKMILTLVNGGSLLDFRTKDGKTALHRAVEKDNFDSLKTLLDLGSSPNYKDSRGLTSLYYSVLYGCDPRLTELLLHDHALIGATDPQGWQEVHQACKHGLVQHLEHLLFYGADLNAHNASGNTPLHVCAVNDQESCARVLLFRGADKGALNYANQNPYQVAVIAGNLNLAEIIQKHRPEDVVPYREVPKYNPRRRASSMAPSVLNRAQSDPHLDALGIACSPLSPCPSSQYPFSSSVSTLSEASSTGSSSSATTQMGSEMEDTASGVTDKSLLSDSSGVCTSHSGTSYEDSGSELLPEGGSLRPLRPGAICVCLEDYQVALPGHLNLVHGDLLEVLGLTECGLYQGKTREGEEGLFPALVVQEVKLRSDLSPNGEQPSSRSVSRVEGRREMTGRKVSTVPRRWRLLESHYGEPRTVILHKGKKGFGFVLRGAKATSPLMERQPSEYWPSLQYLDDVDKGGVADMAGLKKGDFLLEINGQDVSQASHEHVVTIIRHSGDLVAMTVVTVQPPNSGQTPDQRPLVPRRQCATLPRKLSTKKAPVPPKRDPKTTLSVGRARARSMVAGLAEIEVLDRSLNEYDSEGRSTKSSSIESIPNKQSATTTPSEASSSTHNTNNSGSPALAQKIASIRARPSSRRITATELEDFFSRQKSEGVAGGTLPAHLVRGPKVYGSLAALKRGGKGAASRRIASSASDARLHKEFHSSPDLNGLVANQVLCNGLTEQTTGLGDPLSKRRSHSQEDLQGLMLSRHQWGSSPHSYTRTGMDYKDAWKSVEEIYERVKAQDEEERRETDSGIYAETLPLTTKSSSNSSGSTSAVPPMRAPPPSHPPPPPPVGQVVKVDVSRAMGEYANVVRQEKTTVMSSFRPGDSAKLYESPDAVMTGSIGIKKEAKRSSSGPRSQSLPPRIAAGRPPYRAPSSEAESSGDSLYSAFKVLHRPGREQAESLSSERSATLKGVKGKTTRPYSPKFCPEGDSEVESPSHPPSHHPHYHSGGSMRNHHPGHEPFIPEPDYDSSTSEEEPADKGTLVTFGKAEEIPLEGGPQEGESAGSPHTEAKKAIQEAKQRLKLSEAEIAQKNAKERARKATSPIAAQEDNVMVTSGHGELLLVASKEKEELSPLVEVTSTSVKVNISVFERKSEVALQPPQPPAQPQRSVQPPQQQQLPQQPHQQPQQPQPQVLQQQPQVRSGESQAAALRRLNEGIKTALSGTLTRLNQERCRAQMKTSKSCPKDFVGEDNSSSGVSSDIETASANDDQSPYGMMHSSCTLPHHLLNRHQQHYLMQQHQQQGRVGIVRKGSLPDAGALVALKDRLGHQSQQGPDRRVRHVPPGPNSEVATRRPGRSRARSHEDDADETDMEEDEEVVRRVPPAGGGGAVRVPVDSLGLAAVNEVDVMTELLPPPPEFAIPGGADGHHARPAHVPEAFVAPPPPPQFSDESLMMMMRRSGVQRVQMPARMRQVAGAQQQQQQQQYRYHPDYASRSATLQHPHKQHQSAQHLQQQQLYGTLRESKQAQSMHRPVAAEVVRAAEAARAAEMVRATEMARLAEAARQAATTAPKPQHKEFRVKCLHEWNCRDVCDWLDSLFLSEYKSRFTEAGITGAKLSNMDNNDLMGLGVKQVGHRLNIERSIKRYLK